MPGLNFVIEAGGLDAKKIKSENEEKISKLETTIEFLKKELELSNRARFEAEDRAEKLQEELDAVYKKKRRTKEEILAAQSPYSEYKSDGKRKARPADPIRSYQEFHAIQEYFLNAGKIRDWAMWTIGVSLGVRISDLLNLKIGSIIDENRNFRQRVLILEQKTSKINNCLITEAVVDAAKKYFDAIKWNFTLDDYLFPSAKTKGKMYEEYGWKILSDAGKALKLDINIGSHTMRKTFANVAACVDKSSIDMNAITKIQGLLNHSDQKVTMRYLGTYQLMFDKARIAVSDFVLGKSNVDLIVAGNNFTIDDVIAKLDTIEKSLKQ